MTIVANEKNNLFSPEGCSRKGPVRFNSCSNTSSGSGRFGPFGLFGGTLLEYGEPAFPISGSNGLLFPPSCRLYLVVGPAKVAGGCGKSPHSIEMKPFETVDDKPDDKISSIRWSATCLPADHCSKGAIAALKLRSLAIAPCHPTVLLMRDRLERPRASSPWRVPGRGCHSEGTSSRHWSGPWPRSYFSDRWKKSVRTITQGACNIHSRSRRRLLTDRPDEGPQLTASHILRSIRLDSPGIDIA